MREGAPLIINCDKMVPDFKTKFTSTDEGWPSALIFDKYLWAKKEHHMKVVRPEEDTDMGGVSGVHGVYEMLPEFNLIILSRAENEEML